MGLKAWLVEIKISLRAVLCLAIVLCGIYPLTVWILNQGLFPKRSNGSLEERAGQILGSSLLSQAFTEPRYFHPRPSAAGQGHDAARSGASNLGPTSKKLAEAIRERVDAYRRENGLLGVDLVPADAVTASASGLDPHISLGNAFLQAGRVARARGLAEADVRHLVERLREGRTLGILGEPRVNVLVLNLALDGVRHGGE
jgi:K+-transporting ATPase ATPase C chain